MFQRPLSYLRGLIRRRRIEREAGDELRFHLGMARTLGRQPRRRPNRSIVS